jgi:hypothetical protein
MEYNRDYTELGNGETRHAMQKTLRNLLIDCIMTEMLAEILPTRKHASVHNSLARLPNQRRFDLPASDVEHCYQ